MREWQEDGDTLRAWKLASYGVERSGAVEDKESVTGAIDQRHIFRV